MAKVERTSRLTWIIVILLIAVLVMSAVNMYALFASLTTGSTVLAPIKIGFIAPLSPPGGYAAGMYMVKGAKLAAKEINQAGGVLGRQIQLIFEDSAGTPEKGLAAATKLISEDGVCAITGLYHSSVADVVSDLCETSNIPCLGLQCSARKLTEKGYITFFRTQGLDYDKALGWTQIAHLQGWKRIAVASPDNAFGVGMVTDQDAAIKNLNYTDMVTKSWVFPAATVDFVPTLLAIKDWNPDLVVQTNTGAQLQLFVKQSYDVGLFPKVPQINPTEEPRLAEYWNNVGAAGTYLMGLTFAPKNESMLSADGRKMIVDYRAEYGEDSVYSVWQSYDGIYILAEALKLAGTDKPADIINALRTGTFTNVYTGPKITFPEILPKDIRWHQCSSVCYIWQYTKANQAWADTQILYPFSVATANYTYPA